MGGRVPPCNICCWGPASACAATSASRRPGQGEAVQLLLSACQLRLITSALRALEAARVSRNVHLGFRHCVGHWLLAAFGALFRLLAAGCRGKERDGIWGGLGLSREGFRSPRKPLFGGGGRDSGKSTVGRLSLWAPPTNPAPLTLSGLEPGRGGFQASDHAQELKLL